MTSTTPLAFVDTETTGLDPFLHDAWEYAVILRTNGHDEEHTYRIEPDLTNADPKALEINPYWQRTSAPGWEWDDRRTAATSLYALLNGAVMIGSNPAFDAGMIANLFGRYYAQPQPWHYRVVDIATLAAGFLHGALAIGDPNPRMPYSSRDLSRAVGVQPPGDDGHQALVDARWARDVYDAVMHGQLAEEQAA